MAEAPADPPVPPVTEEMREHARVQPDSWLYVLDPAADPDTAVRPELVVGAFPVDSRGELGTPFEHNPAYRPSAVAAPTDPLDAALQDLAAGRGSHEAVLALLRTAELHLGDPGDGGFVRQETASGRDVVQAFTSPEHAHAGAAACGTTGGAVWQLRRGRELARLLPTGVDLLLNPGSAVAVTVPGETLLR